MSNSYSKRTSEGDIADAAAGIIVVTVAVAVVGAILVAGAVVFKVAEEAIRIHRAHGHTPEVKRLRNPFLAGLAVAGLVAVSHVEEAISVAAVVAIVSTAAYLWALADVGKRLDPLLPTPPPPPPVGELDSYLQPFAQPSVVTPSLVTAAPAPLAPRHLVPVLAYSSSTNGVHPTVSPAQ